VQQDEGGWRLQTVVRGCARTRRGFAEERRFEDFIAAPWRLHAGGWVLCLILDAVCCANCRAPSRSGSVSVFSALDQSRSMLS